MNREQTERNDSSAMPRRVLELKHKYIDEYHDYLELLRGRLAVGTIDETLVAHSRAVVLATKATDEAESNMRKIDDAMLLMIREQRAQNEEHIGDALATDDEYLRLGRLHAEQLDVRDRLRLVVDEYRQREVDRRLEHDQLLVAGVEGSPTRIALFELKKKMYYADIDYRLRLAAMMCDS